MFAEMGVGSGVYGGYTLEYTHASFLPLDPITCSGALNLRAVVKMMKGEFPKWSRILQSILDGEVGVTSLVQTEVPHVSSRYKDHMSALIASDMILLIGPLHHDSSHVFISGYFAVPKDDTCSRSILNGKKVSSLCAPPPPVNLLELRRMLKLACEHVGAFWQMDLRHWFHQIRLTDVSTNLLLHRLFNIVWKDNIYKWRNLPMGWSWSPFICQLIAWTLCLHTEKNESPIFVAEDFSGQGLPPYVRVARLLDGAIIGFICLTYDNIGVFCSEDSAVVEVRRRILRNMKMFGAVVKDGSNNLFHYNEMRADRRCRDDETSKLPVHLGIEFGVIMRHRCKALQWRIDPKKICTWTKTTVGISMSCRFFAAWCGRIFRWQYVRGGPLFQVEAAIEVLRLTSASAEKGTWDDLMVLPTALFVSLSQLWCAVLRNEWTSLTNSSIVSKTVYVFSDASGNDGWGYAVCDHGGLISQGGGQWNESTKNLHIFVKEVLAAVWAVQYSKSNSKIVLCIDNTAAKTCVERGFSSCRIANDAIKALYSPHVNL